MTRIGKAKRLVFGLGVMALGILGALPFRHSPGSDETPSDQTANDAKLGQGVELQVPGQAISRPSQVPELRPMPAEKEPEKPAEEEVSQSEWAKHSTPPPQLPDEYYPLYRPENRDRVEAGRVVPSDHHGTSDRQPRTTHTIRDGDTLPLLAQRYLGDPERGAEIMEANRSVLSDPEVLPIGVEIIIPSDDARAHQSDIDASSDLEIPKLVPLPPMDSTR